MIAILISIVQYVGQKKVTYKQSNDVKYRNMDFRAALAYSL